MSDTETNRKLRALYKSERRRSLREEILKMNEKGMSNVQIAQALNLSESTVRTLLLNGSK